MSKLLAAKEKSGKTFTQIGLETGLTNIYTAALFYNQQQLKPETAKAIQLAVPALAVNNHEGLTLIEEMQKAPSRR